MGKNKKVSIVLRQAKTSSSGFTIVELLIVIVVVGVLAAIVLIGYSNIRTLANDASIKNDLRNVYDKLAYYKNMSGSYPKDNAAELASRGMGLSKNAYDTASDFNLSYCYNYTTDNYLIASRSKSGGKYAIGSDLALKQIPGTATNDGLSSSSDCSDVAAGYTRLYAGYDKNNYYNGYVPGDTVPWRRWVESPSVIDAKDAQ